MRKGKGYQQDIEKAIETLERFLDAFYEFPDWHVLSEEDTEAIETLIEFAKEESLD